ncbi:MAG: DUF1858 domain-containing protein [Clostridia bacterium]|jgi:hybrid cluster-associated redox disulfide protein|nr:DUF1858 domain-containing protein [Clostridia bacterium]MBR0436742.1 DUF1858 domain-containing protein [Clostridia bacterium]MBR2644806.1 DUF1858 domain-containing protein [Clostridia bacterium]MBR3037100.1 DUF1858 domain-containing protein [Clostridia bacterium]
MITKDMNIQDILKVDENLAGILIASGMHCLGCAMSHFENLEQACAVHGIDCDELCNAMNEYLENK